jgi:hypothetical protein
MRAATVDAPLTRIEGAAMPAGALAVDPAQQRDAGMSTAEYAIGTVAACGFAGLLLKLLTGGEVAGLLRSVVEHAFSFAS